MTIYNGWTPAQSDTESIAIAQGHANTLKSLLGTTIAREYIKGYLHDGMTRFETAQALGRAVANIGALVADYNYPSDKIQYWVSVAATNVQWEINHADSPERAAQILRNFINPAAQQTAGSASENECDFWHNMFSN